MASNRSALEVTVPAWVLRDVFFFSFSLLGLMVSLLGFVLTLPFPSLPETPRSGPRSWGIEETGSVSMVIVLGGSFSGLILPALRLVKDRLASSEAGLDALGALDLRPFSVLFEFDLDGPSPPLPSPSLVSGVSVFGSFRGSRAWASIFWSNGDAGTGPIDGVVGTLLSATVSRALVPALGPRPEERRLE